MIKKLNKEHAKFILCQRLNRWLRMLSSILVAVRSTCVIARATQHRADRYAALSQKLDEEAKDLR